MDNHSEGLAEAVLDKLHTKSIPDHTGDHYYVVLKRIHDLLRPACYFEIGTRTGESLALARCASISVDPKFRITKNVVGEKPLCAFFQTGSDDFFRNVDPKTIFGRPIDFAFLDGMHLFEFLLRDFANTEKHCVKNSVIALHDCLPPEAGYTTRMEYDLTERNVSRHPDWWTGDVWKTSVILKKLRPDLRMLALDASPTGLVLITNLDPDSKYLEENYSDIISDFAEIKLETYGIETLIAELQVCPTSSVSTLEDLSKHFWL